MDLHRTVEVGGSSFGGLAATCCCATEPRDLRECPVSIGLTQQGGLHQKVAGPLKVIQMLNPTAVAKQFIASPSLPLRFYMDAGSDEIDVTMQGSDILVPNRQLRDVLLAKGYEVHYQEFNGGHDGLSWRGTRRDGLIALDKGNSLPRNLCSRIPYEIAITLRSASGCTLASADMLR